MPAPDQEQLQKISLEAQKWLRYYRDLGFTHLCRAPSESEGAPPAALEKLESAAPVQPDSPGCEETSLPRSKTFSSPPPVARTGPAADLFAASAPRETLDEVRADLGQDCRRCKLAGGRKTIVFGSGNPRAELVFVGEGPGADEDEQGLPFVGRAGQLLTDMIEKGLKIPRPDVYICNIVKCRPPGNRKPERDEIAACRQFVERQIAAIGPRVICALGSTAAETLLDVKESMGRLRGKQYEFSGIPLIITYHPAFLLRDPSRKADTWSDLKMILALLRP